MPWGPALAWLASAVLVIVTWVAAGKAEEQANGASRQDDQIAIRGDTDIRDPGDAAADASATEPSEDLEPLPRLVFEPVAPRRLTGADLPPGNVLSSRFNLSPRVTARFDQSSRSTSNAYRPIVERESNAFAVPPALVDGIMAVESSYDAGVIGMDGEIGLMQVMPATARMMGFTGSTAQLADPETNIHFGTKYLAAAWRLARGDLCTAAMKYRAGHGETRFSTLSVEYCRRLRTHLAARGVVVSGELPQPTFGSREGSRTAGKRAGPSESLNVADLNLRLRAMTERAVSTVAAR